MPARVSVRGADGRYFAPDDAWRHADEAFDRAEGKFEYGYFHTTGESKLTLPAGEISVEVLRGLEWKPFVKSAHARRRRAQRASTWRSSASTTCRRRATGAATSTCT